MATSAKATMFSGAALSPSEVGGGGGIFPTRLAAASLHFSIVGVRRTMKGLHVPQLRMPDTPCGGNSGGGIEIATYTLPIRAKTLHLEHEAAADLQSVVVAQDAPLVKGTRSENSALLVGSVDALGRATLHRLDVPEDAWSGTSADNEKNNGSRVFKRAKREEDTPATGIVLGGDGRKDHTLASACEWGWSGMAFSCDDQAASVAVVHQLARSLRIYDTATGADIVRGFNALPPRALTWLSPKLLCVAETTCATIWDIRVKNSSGASCFWNAPEERRAELSAIKTSEDYADSISVKWRQQPSHRGLLNAVSPFTSNGDCKTGQSDFSNSLAVASDDRMVYVFDVRKTFRATKRWRCPCKYELTSIHQSRVVPGLLYVSGLDNEFLTCSLESSVEKLKLKTSEQPTRLQGNAKSSGISAERSIDVPEVGGHGRLHQTHRLGVRGDSRWVGVSVAGGYANETEALIGLCSSGTLCILKDPKHAEHCV